LISLALIQLGFDPKKALGTPFFIVISSFRSSKIFLKLGLAFLFSMFCFFQCFAEETEFKHLVENDWLTIGGTYRVRGEMTDNFNVSYYGTNKLDSFLLSQLRLEVDLKPDKNLKIHTQIQDAEVINQPIKDENFKGKNNPFHDPVDINELYLEYWLVNNFGIKLGRQKLLFGGRRIFGPGDWGNTGRYSWDAIRLMYRSDIFDSDFITGKYIIHDPDVWPDKHIDGVTTFALYNSIKKLPLPLDLFYVLKYDNRGITKGEKGAGDVGNMTSHNIGFRIDGKRGQWNYEITFVKEFGKWAKDQIDAYGYVLALGYTFDVRWKPQIVLQYVVGSGDKDPKDGKHNTFSGVYSGSDTVFYGWMNMFFWQNLREYRVDFILNPEKTFTLRGEYHYFTLDTAKDGWYFPGNMQRRDKTGLSGKELGNEVDLILDKKFGNRFDILLGYSFFAPGEFIKNTGSHEPANWCFLQTTFSF
jgi:hypothetical protein